MPVQKFRSIEDMNRAPVRAEPGRRTSSGSCATAPATGRSRRSVYPRGVFKFRSIEDAQHDHDTKA